LDLSLPSWPALSLLVGQPKQSERRAQISQTDSRHPCDQANLPSPRVHLARRGQHCCVQFPAGNLHNRSPCRKVQRSGRVQSSYRRVMIEIVVGLAPEVQRRFVGGRHEELFAPRHADQRFATDGAWPRKSLIGAGWIGTPAQLTRGSATEQAIDLKKKTTTVCLKTVFARLGLGLVPSPCERSAHVVG
jgi:hypothetical protein